MNYEFGQIEVIVITSFLLAFLVWVIVLCIIKKK